MAADREDQMPVTGEKLAWEKPVLFKLGMDQAESNINPGPEILILVS